ncbi:hypothetical protein [Lentzea sp. NEAU-D7]|uniref:hypothetical protein n=1 Tax=Lentzea sp. NEAU-D7 TaxID=2994667 RepID=UPI00224AEB4A|nr:hypothetical protein [Lentzea sp. NEAU-D7]MCX2952703.1 hypothetical protein [Lentzea sp. NEAU-D7]
MPEKFGAPERAALMVLMSENRKMLNTELNGRVRLTKAGRGKLNKAGLLRTDEDVTPMVHEITDQGISWCLTDLVDGELPPRTPSHTRAAFGLLKKFVLHHKERGTLVEVIRSRDLESMIRSVYEELAVEPQDWIRLARIRPRLNGVEKGEVDEVLVKMSKTGTVHLAPESNTKVLTPEDHAAALRVGSEDLHLVAMEES